MYSWVCAHSLPCFAEPYYCQPFHDLSPAPALPCKAIGVFKKEASAQRFFIPGSNVKNSKIFYLFFTFIRISVRFFPLHLMNSVYTHFTGKKCEDNAELLLLRTPFDEALLLIAKLPKCRFYLPIYRNVITTVNIIVFTM